VVVHESEPLMSAIGSELVMSVALIACVFLMKRTQSSS